MHTSHWGVVPLFHQFYPKVRLKPEKVLALAGPEHRIITAGGAASWGEMALYLIARFCGQEEAVRSSKVFLLGDRSEGQLPFAAMTRPRGHSDAIVEKCQAWIAEHDDPASFRRLFKRMTGVTPARYRQCFRIIRL